MSDDERRDDVVGLRCVWSGGPDMARAELWMADPPSPAVVRGELCVATSAPLGRELLALVDGSPDGMVLDLSGVTFLDSQGIKMLLRLYWRCAENGSALVLENPSERVVSVLDLVGLTERFTVAGERTAPDGEDGRETRQRPR